MALFDGGLFILLAAIGFGFTFYAFNATKDYKQVIFRFLGAGCFMVLSLFTAAGYEVGISTSETKTITEDFETLNGTDIITLNSTRTETNTQTETWIPAGTMSSALSYLFMALAVLNFIFLIKDLAIGQQKIKRGNFD